MKIILTDDNGTVLDSMNLDSIGDLTCPLPQATLIGRVNAAIASSMQDTCSYCFSPIDPDMEGICSNCQDKIDRGTM